MISKQCCCSFHNFFLIIMSVKYFCCSLVLVGWFHRVSKNVHLTFHDISYGFRDKTLVVPSTDQTNTIKNNTYLY